MTLNPISNCRALPFLCLFTAALLSMSTLAGCSSSQMANLDPQVVPDEFELTLSQYTTEGKHTYFTLNPEGELAFAGGRAAVLRNASPVFTLTPAQRLEVWSLIINSDMLKTKNQLFKSPEETAYDVTIDAGKSFRSKSFHVTDEKIPPAVIQLHDRLFSWQADVRYKAPVPTADPKD